MNALLNRAMMFFIPLLLLGACGGGGGGGDMGSSSTANAQNSFSAGAISGFGSVIVNGVHWSDDSSVQVTLDDDPGTKDDLRVGMVVEVEGDDNGNGTGKARKIRFENIVRGPIQSVDLVGGTLVVLGQTVKVGGATVFDDVADLASLNPGDIVAVSGWFDSLDPTLPNNIVARRVEKKPVPFSGVLKVKGFVKSLDSAGRTFKINNLVVDFGTAQFPNGSAATLKNGLFVDVRTHALPLTPAGTLVAETVRIKEARPSPSEGAQVEVEGIITDFKRDTKTFTVGGIPVDARAIDISGLANGMKVELKGTFVNGVLVVSANKEVEREMEAHVKIEALVQATDMTGRTITLLGKTVLVTAMTQFIDAASAMRTFGLTDIRMNDAVRVRAFEDGSGNLVAAKIIRLQPPLQQVVLQGRMDSKDLTTTSFTILGIKVQGGPSTQWRRGNDRVDATTWFSATALNTGVKAKGVAGADGKSVDVTAGEVQTGEDDD